ncbi:MAG: hypothetical protein NWE99_07330 [Candidatus Bathyarchaeota archaeon]|nr:hypothetical protein [Candidatus Bathyarchaeota archaeon]
MTKLSESQERALTSSLFVIESNLRWIEGVLKEGKPSEQTILYRRKDDVKPKLKPKIIDLISNMLSEIKRVKETFKLETEEIKLRAEISAALNEIWVILVDLEPDRLKAYGELSEDNKALIEPLVQSLLNKLDELRQLL